jgi:hypothetical protein
LKTLKFFRIDLVVLALALVVAYLYGSWTALYLTAVLVVVEIVFSFDNAAVNAKYLVRMSAFWQKMFLTVGILIAVFGMRLVFPFVIVCVSGGIGPGEAIELALAKGNPSTPGTYGYIINEAHPAIAAFGGMFLFLLFLDFLFDEERDLTWLSWIEKPLMQVGRLNQLSVVIAGIALILISELLVHEVEERATVLFSGLLGLLVYLLVNGLASVMEEKESSKTAALGANVVLTGKAALSMFMFLEVLDATFSFDGVIGAFAITPDPIIIALGLGVGALFVRSMTIYLVRTGSLVKYRYLEHGAHWAIGALAVMLLLSISVHLPEAVIGSVSILFILAALVSSVIAAKRDPEGEERLELGEDLDAPAPGIYTSHSNTGPLDRVSR